MGKGGPGDRRPFDPARKSKRTDGYTRNGFFIPSMSKPIVSFQQFSALQTRHDVKSLKYQYGQYKKEHREEHPKAFWREHEKEPWFMEKYNPLTIYQIKQESIELASQKSAKYWASCPLANLDLGASDEASHFKFDPNHKTIYLKQIPVFVSR